ncbi:MAG TPA: 4-demethylwyosine synthase TYW1 [Methanothermobacter sp.]|nr:oxidoreductase [Methanothermobacter sp. MT-2]HHW05448.1 4-demethylwyosine synthase TYW1 [Methanothermobacter sp.]HOK73216.1 4-demethylwyosine synthase TYW1 [Methanothermobacter sp.]HOL68836.1 4-demethylwyosine synthase TYW1 [Methanothermobacter sp.]HPQ04729.1 4-demethylwyosine synthase TYW1 [Methanothermobacter sp.]
MFISKSGKIKRLEKMGYRFVGENAHTAVKTCLWTKKSILDEGTCYKQKFYDIKSHRCLQMSPSIFSCQQKCLFCWRDLRSTKTAWEGDYDEPASIIDDCINAQRNLLCGFFGNEKANKKKLLEAQKPNNAAISLAGEPLLYPMINELIKEFHKRKFTTFLVTNGINHKALENLSEEPTQLYISLDAPSKKIHNKICRPQTKNAWECLNRSLELFPSFNCRKVLRITAVNGKNMTNPSGYASLIKKAQPDFVEVKAYMYLGYSRQRLEIENMPLFFEVYEFADEIAKLTNMDIIDESKESRVVLLG